ncbi:hypothetical protein DIPPA_04796 [Diplonema papillatum]|nr:hypothetical protein DIPPA_04796 [Diplonema papillatum]
MVRRAEGLLLGAAALLCLGGGCAGYSVPNYMEIDYVSTSGNCSAGGTAATVGSVVEFGYAGQLFRADTPYFPRVDASRRYLQVKKKVTIGSLAAAFPGTRSTGAGGLTTPSGLLEVGLDGACPGDVRRIILPPRLAFDNRQVERVSEDLVLVWEVEVLTVDGKTY